MTNPNARPCDEGAIRAVRPAPARVANQGAWVLAATILGSAMAYIDGSVVNVALPAIEGDLKTSVVVIQWLINAYELCVAALVLIGGAAGDRLGRRRIFISGILIFAVASLGCGVAQSAPQLIAARAVQGFGAALLIPCSLAIIGTSFSEAERGKAIGTWAGVSSIAAAIGPLLGGWIVDHASWRWIFLINPFLALPTIWITLRHVLESRDADARSGLDWPGAVLAMAGLGSLVYGLIASSDLGWGSLVVWGSTLGGVVLLGAFLWWEGHSPAPMMPLGLFASPMFSGVNLLTLLLYAAIGGAFFFLPFDLIQVHGYSATSAGAVFLPFTLIMGGLSRWSGGLLDRFGARLPLVVGPAIAALGFGLLALHGTDGPYWATFLLPVVVLGLGFAVSVAPLTTSVINSVPTHQAGVASGVNNAVASVASLLAVAIFGAIALNLMNNALDRRVASQPMSIATKQIVEASRGTFVIASPGAPVQSTDRQADRQIAAVIVRASLSDGIRLVMWLAAALALAGAVCAAATIRPGTRNPPPP